MLQKIKTAIDKLLFCYRVSADICTFVRLIVHTKKYRRYNRTTSSAPADNPIAYRLLLNNITTTIHLRTYAGDIEIFYEIFWKRVYAHLLLSTKNFQTIVDLGANIGMATLLYALEFPTAQVYALEPDAENFELLTANLADEVLTGRVIPVRAAISNQNGKASIQKANKAYNSTISAESSPGMEVRTITMSSFVRDMMINRIDLLKIDIEGWEEQLFLGEIEWLSITDNIVMECHSEKIKENCITVLQSNGFSTYTSDLHATLVWAIKN
ncbi:MAG: FkbM family methyltransferase [Agriterribacter sp.]